MGLLGMHCAGLGELGRASSVITVRGWQHLNKVGLDVSTSTEEVKIN